MIEIRELDIADYDALIALWRGTPGIGLSTADSRDSIASFLDRNPGMSFAAWDGERLLGSVLCGHDGRRGYLYHLVVAPTHRRQGFGAKMVKRCLESLRACGIEKCHLFVYRENVEGRSFWRSVDWEERVELVIMSRVT